MKYKPGGENHVLQMMHKFTLVVFNPFFKFFGEEPKHPPQYITLIDIFTRFYISYDDFEDDGQDKWQPNNL